MKILHFVAILCIAACATATEENCIEKSDPCTGITEYNSYISCLDENRRHKRSLGCSHHQENCEYVDCQNCQDACLTDCPECECPSSCRQCCSETCSTNLCCHKTCHNQCKTNYCRTECKRECKQRFVEHGTGQDTDVGVNIVENRNSTNLGRHNITTIINLHNIINNTNLIDIPIKINNTNYNNITLKTRHGSHLTGGGYTNYEEGSSDSSNGDSEEKCCYVVGPRQCVKTNYYPFMKCFHYRYRKCGPYCVTTIVHAQPQNYCDDTGCHNKMFYIPQFQPRCHPQSAWPFVSCGGHQQYHNCHGCYDHQFAGNSHHHIRCSRCYNDGTQPYYRQGPLYQPSGYPGAFGGYPNMPFNYFPQMYNNPGYGYPAMATSGYSGYGYPPMPISNYPGYGYPNYYGQQYYGGNPGSDTIKEEIIDAPKTENNDLNLKSNYPVGSYIHETVIPADHLVKSSLHADEQASNSTEENSSYASRYALISIDAAKPNHHNKREEKKEKKIKKRKDKMEPDHEETKKEEKSVTENRLTTEKKSTLSPQK